MKKALLLLIAVLNISSIRAEVLTVGNDGDGYRYSELRQAAADAKPGDTIMVFDASVSPSQYIENLHGQPGQYIYIIAYPDREVVYSGHGESWHLSSVSYLHIKGFIFEKETSNGVNIDDGGTLTAPSHHIYIESCTFRDMNASGNNDMLKISGVDTFAVRNCSFTNGSAGGSMIDMVGCHAGIFEGNIFTNGGSNSIQAKGGSENIYILRNTFINGGARGINIGGSTGEPYFRPPGAWYESRNILVFANVFFGSQAPVAFVGTVNSRVVNNTFIEPGKWALRILQENTDKLACADNYFVNNLVYINDDASSPAINIGPDTKPETFTFSRNLWYDHEDDTWAGPNLPVESDDIINSDPFITYDNYQNISFPENSPLVGNGRNFQDALPSGFIDFTDYYGRQFGIPPSIGAVEYYNPSNVNETLPENDLPVLYPNPADGNVGIITGDGMIINSITLYDNTGREVLHADNINEINVSSQPAGNYYLILLSNKGRIVKMLIVE